MRETAANDTGLGPDYQPLCGSSKTRLTRTPSPGRYWQEQAAAIYPRWCAAYAWWKSFSSCSPRQRPPWTRGTRSTYNNCRQRTSMLLNKTQEDANSLKHVRGRTGSIHPKHSLHCLINSESAIVRFAILGITHKLHKASKSHYVLNVLTKYRYILVIYASLRS